MEGQRRRVEEGWRGRDGGWKGVEGQDGGWKRVEGQDGGWKTVEGQDGGWKRVEGQDGGWKTVEGRGPSNSGSDQLYKLLTDTTRRPQTAGHTVKASAETGGGRGGR